MAEKTSEAELAEMSKADPVGDKAQREMLAQMMALIAASQNTQKYSPENLWALQGQQQGLKVPPPEDPEVAWMKAFKNTAGEGNQLPQRQITSSQFDFPMAAPHGTPPGDPIAVGSPPFGGKGQVVGPYELPKSEKKSEPKKAKR
jgi:hypothetical protein